MRRVDITQTAISTPFNNTGSTIIATDVEAAIKELDSQVTGKPRAIVGFGFDGSASNRWLEGVANVGSDISPFITAEAATIKALAIVSDISNTCTATVYKNAVALTTLSTSAALGATVSGLSFSLVAGDKISVKITSGTISKPSFYVSLEVNL